MKTAQGEVSLPAVERYVRRLEAGEVPPAIKVDGNVKGSVNESVLFTKSFLASV